MSKKIARILPEPTSTTPENGKIPRTGSAIPRIVFFKLYPHPIEVHVHQYFAKLPEPPYYSVIFSSLRTSGDRGYGSMADRMVELAVQQPGFLGAESARDDSGFGITVSYWQTLESISRWKANAEHKIAQETGQRDWYAHYELRIARVERAYSKEVANLTREAPDA